MEEDKIKLLNCRYTTLLKEFLIERFCNWLGAGRAEELKIEFPKTKSTWSGLSIQTVVDELFINLL